MPDRAAREILCNGASKDVALDWIEEVPVALEFNGLAYAVMMASPINLEDFVRGFALTEGLAKQVEDISSITIAKTDKGIIARAQLTGLGIEQLSERVRMRVAESSCGLCGIENLEALAKPLPKVPAHTAIDEAAIFAATAAMRGLQTLNARTGSAHGAAFADEHGHVLIVREDVGRHNAMDKLVGALALTSHVAAQGMMISTARCSYEIVEKAVRAGASRLVTVSLPTSMAVDRASEAGLSLYCLARDDSILEVCAAK